MVWAMKDTFFPVASAEWLDCRLPGSRGVRRVEAAELVLSGRNAGLDRRGSEKSVESS